MAYYVSTVWKSGGRVLRVPHLIATMIVHKIIVMILSW